MDPNSEKKNTSKMEMKRISSIQESATSKKSSQSKDVEKIDLDYTKEIHRSPITRKITKNAHRGKASVKSDKSPMIKK